MSEMSWFLSPNAAAGTLLLVAVENFSPGTGAYPCRVVGEISPVAAAEAVPADDDALRIARLLTEVGVPANLLGYTYLRTALTLILAEPGLRRSMTGMLYPRVAERHGTTARSVERAIRHAIVVTWVRTGDAGYKRALGRLASCVGDRPTNAEFLAQAAERLTQP